MYDNPQIGDYVSFNINEDLIGKGTIIGKSANLAPECANMWIVSIEVCGTLYMVDLLYNKKWKAMVVQQTFLDKAEKPCDKNGRYSN